MHIKRTDAAPAAAHAFDILAIIFVTLLVSTSFVAFTYWSKFRTAEMKWNRATFDVSERVGFRSGDTDVEQLYETEKGLKGEVRDLSRVLGFYKGEEATSNLQSVVTLVNEINEEFKAGQDAAAMPSLLKENKFLTVARAISILESRIDKLVNEADGIKALEKKRDELQGQYEKELGEIGKIRSASAAKVAKLEEDLKGLLSQVKAMRASNASAKSQLLTRRNQSEDAVKRARQQKKIVQKSLFDIKKTYKDEVDRLKDKLDNVLQGVASLEDVVRKITQTERDKDQRRPDGEILSSNSRMQVAWINLTRNDRIMKGMKFEVFRYRKGGKEIARGKVQVIKVGERMSKVRILERYYKGKAWKMKDMRRAPDYVLREFDIDPFQRGDMVRNRFFDKNEKRVFVFAGELTGPPNARASYKAEEAKKLLEELGDEVDRRVNERTSYVVLGKGYKDDPAYKLAEELGIPKMSEKELMEILGKY